MTVVEQIGIVAVESVCMIAGKSGTMVFADSYLGRSKYAVINSSRILTPADEAAAFDCIAVGKQLTVECTALYFNGAVSCYSKYGQIYPY